MDSRLEINFCRLLNRCEVIAGDQSKRDWRLEKAFSLINSASGADFKIVIYFMRNKDFISTAGSPAVLNHSYVGALQDQLGELRKSSSKPRQDVLTEYTRKVDFLKGLIEAENMGSATEKAMAAELLTPAPASSESSGPSRELHIQTKARYQKEVRDELFGTSSDTSNGDVGVRQRKQNSEEDFDTVLKHHNQVQAKLAEEMAHLARNMKENAKAANRIIKDDNKKLEDSTQLADKNYAKLKVESDRLEVHANKACNWWIWIMLIVVCLTFLWMILFMKMFSKR